MRNNDTEIAVLSTSATVLWALAYFWFARWAWQFVSIPTNAWWEWPLITTVLAGSLAPLPVLALFVLLRS